MWVREIKVDKGRKRGSIKCKTGQTILVKWNWNLNEDTFSLFLSYPLHHISSGKILLMLRLLCALLCIPSPTNHPLRRVQLKTFSRTLAYTRKYLTSRVGYPVTVLLRPPLFVVHHLGLQMLFVGAILLFCKRQAKTGRETTTVIGK